MCVLAKGYTLEANVEDIASIPNTKTTKEPDVRRLGL
eukprot:COSAG06_NODE_62705_length_264_cov_0.630303_1_plen_36_part_10